MIIYLLLISPLRRLLTAPNNDYTVIYAFYPPEFTRRRRGGLVYRIKRETFACLWRGTACFCQYKKFPLLLLSILNHSSKILNTKNPSFYNHFPNLGKMVAWLITGTMTGGYSFAYNLREVLPFSIRRTQSRLS